MKVKVAQSYLTLCDPMDYTVHGILQSKILEWVAYPFSRIKCEEHRVSKPQSYGEKKRCVQKETSESSQEKRGKLAENGDRKYVLRREKNNSVKC